LREVKMTARLLEFARQQRHVLSAALIVALFLLLIGHVPMLPVLAGCALGIGLSALRVSSRRWKKAPARHNQRA
jgi:uncharacterized membrane protein YesL